MKRGLEITVLLGDDVVSSRWFRHPASVGVGDSHLFDVFCPLISVDETSITQQDAAQQHAARLQAAGFAIKPVRGVFSVGARLFVPAPGRRVRLTLPAGVGARVGEEILAPQEIAQTRDLAFPFSGELAGEGDWRLRFSAHEVPSASWIAALPRPGFFTQCLLYGVVLLAGLLGLGFLEPGEFTWDELVPGTRHRMAVLQIAPPRKPQSPVVEDSVAERLSNLRVAPRRQTQPAPRPRASRPSQLLRASASRTPARLTHTEHVIDLTDPDAPPADDSPDGPPELDGPGDTVPVVPVAPPPQVNVTPPPPMIAPEPPPKEQQAPRRVFFPKVDYPESARHLGLEGKVKLLLHIDRAGNVTNVEVLAGLHPTLDRAAVAAAKSARYEPAKDTRGRPMASTATVTVRFELEEE